jgi:sugar lactone lactonase YvrE
LIGVDLSTNKVFKKIIFPQDVALPTSYVNDVRFDLRRGSEGTAYITDSSTTGPNGIIVVDLASGKSWRKLHDHASTKPDPGFIPIVEGEQMWKVSSDGKRERVKFGSDGIAISPDGQTLYYCPLGSRHLYSVSTNLLADPAIPGDKVGADVKDLGDKGASDGMETDAQGRVYAGDYEHDALHRRSVDGTWETLAHDPRILWPDTLSVTDGYLYFTANQLERQKIFHAGKDLRQKPYVLFRIKVDGTRIKQ